MFTVYNLAGFSLLRGEKNSNTSGISAFFPLPPEPRRHNKRSEDQVVVKYLFSLLVTATV